MNPYRARSRATAIRRNLPRPRKVWVPKIAPRAVAVLAAARGFSFVLGLER